MGETRTGGLLGGRIVYAQFSTGHRTGFEPVLLAAAIPAKPGERVLEAGTGAGAALLCLAARVGGITGIGVERDAALARLALKNFKSNHFDNLFVVQADAAALPFPAASFDHVCANPPWFSQASTASPDARRAFAHQAPDGLLRDWIGAMCAALRPKGTITLILPASGFAEAAALLRTAGNGGITLTPLHPGKGRPPRLILLSARKHVRSPDRIAAGLTLHEAGGIAAGADAILRHGRALWEAGGAAG